MSANKIGENNSKNGARGRGRPKGSPNKTPAAVKDMILQALASAGGAKYLEKQSEKNPGAFMQLVGKVLPLDVNANVGGAIEVVFRRG